VSISPNEETDSTENNPRGRIERPASLFKYCSPERVDVIERLKVRFTQPILFNDIFECLPGTDQSTDFRRASYNYAAYIGRTIAQHPQWDRRARREFERREARKFAKWCKNEAAKSHHIVACEEVQVLISATVGVFSLSAKWDNTLMWSHYAQDHKGFVIEFDGKHSFFDYGLEKVVYSDERPLFLDRPDGRNDPAVFNTKSKDWEYEQEYRKSEYFGKESMLPNGNKFVEFPQFEEIDQQHWPIHLLDLPPSAIRKLIFGYRASDETRLRLRTALKQEGLRHVLSAQARPHPTLFKMEQTSVQR
jgi:hypothetical protein